MHKGSILVAPLNWGLGHATRCIPIIKALQQHGYNPLIASDGAALDLLKKEFPELDFFTLPSLKIKYARKGFWFKFKIILQIYRLYQCTAQERKFLKRLSSKIELKGIIADNRLGLYHETIPCAIISHQLKVYSGSTTQLTSRLHQFFIKKYDECWVPDNADKPNLSGRLSHLKQTTINLKYIGLLSRFELKEESLQYDILILLSGPEPQRSLLEKKMLKAFKDYDGKVIMVRGVVEDEEVIYFENSIKIINYLKAQPLEKLILQSKIVIARSGYTTLMDLAKLNKKAFFIPTPGQYEQQYLAKRLMANHLAPFCQQQQFKLEQLKKIDFCSGLSNGIFNSVNFSRVFNLFDGK